MGVIQAHYIYSALHFYYYYISSTSDHQALDTGGRGAWPYWILPKPSFGGSPFAEWELSPERTCTLGQPMTTESLAQGEEGSSVDWLPSLKEGPIQAKLMLQSSRGCGRRGQAEADCILA